MPDETQQSILPDPGPSKIVHKARENYGTVETFLEMPFQTITLQPNVWTQINYATYFEGPTLTQVNSLHQIPMWMIAGWPADYTNNGNPNIATSGVTEVPNYLFNQLTEINFQWKDFMWMVERTTSGGIQFKDEPVLEFYTAPLLANQKTRGSTGDTLEPINNIFNPNNDAWNWDISGPSASGNITPTNNDGVDNIPLYVTSTGSNGFTRNFKIDQGWGYTSDMISYLGEDNNTAHFPRGFDTFGQWIKKKSIYGLRPGIEASNERFEEALFTQKYIDRNTRCNFPNESSFLRCRNIPLGLTNVDVKLKFTVIISCKWNVKYKSIVPVQNFLPQPNLIAPPMLSGCFPDLKKSVKRRRPCMYSDEED